MTHRYFDVNVKIKLNHRNDWTLLKHTLKELNSQDIILVALTNAKIDNLIHSSTIIVHVINDEITEDDIITYIISNIPNIENISIKRS